MASLRDVLKCRFEWTLPNGTQGLNVLHATRVDLETPDGDDCAALADALVSWYEDDNFGEQTNERFRDWVSIHTSLVDVIVSDAGAGPSVQATVESGEAGQVSGDPVPAETCFVNTWYTASAGRRARGRTFWPCTGVSALADDGTWEATFVSGVQDTLEALRIGLADHSPYQLVVLSLEGQTAGNGAIFPITSSVVRDTPVHQRRRRN